MPLENPSIAATHNKTQSTEIEPLTDTYQPLGMLEKPVMKRNLIFVMAFSTLAVITSLLILGPSPNTKQFMG